MIEPVPDRYKQTKNITEKKRERNGGTRAVAVVSR